MEYKDKFGILKIDNRDQKELLKAPFSIEFWETQEERDEGISSPFVMFNENDFNEAVHYADKIFWDTISAASVEVYNADGEVIYGLYDDSKEV